MTATFVDADGTTRLTGNIKLGGTTGQVATVQADGTLAPAAASVSLVSCVLARETAFSVRTVDPHPIPWGALYNNMQEFTPLLAIPAGLGLTFAFDGSSADITTTTAGVWSFAYFVTLASDASWTGYLDSRFSRQAVVMSASIADTSLTAVLALPSGTVFGPLIGTLAQATANPYECSSAYLVATRLG